MKRLCFAIIFFVFCCFFIFSESDEQADEIDYLLFMPNSGDRFINQKQADNQLDKIAEYLLARELVPGQIIVYGYSAVKDNDIDSEKLSRERALFVINELQKRGIPSDLLPEPVAFGEVALWGGNTNERDRILNRRVRVLLDGTILTPAIIEDAEPEIEPEAEPEIAEEIIEETIQDEAVIAVIEETAEEESSGFRWEFLLLLLLIPLIAAILFFLLYRKKKTAGAAAATETAPIAAAAALPIIVPVAEKEIDTDLDDEIRFRAYELSLQRNGQYGDAEGDWHVARNEVCARYEAEGCQTKLEEDWHWHAVKTVL